MKKKRKKKLGFTLESRGRVRAIGLVAPVGDERTCLADALWVVNYTEGPEAPQTLLVDISKFCL